MKVRLDRDRHMILTGKRHPFVARYRVVVGRSGDLRALDLELYADGGWSLDLSDAVLGRAMFHSDNGYFFPAMRVRGQVLKTHKTSQTAFRGFGGPQGARRVRLAWTRMTSGRATCIAGRARPTPPTMGRRLVTTGS
ncbi:MAG: hypothetical protein EBT47_11735 [Chloroflexi bacterium]|nr:hypothetical protein [Chloroflexota bacterium]